MIEAHFRTSALYLQLCFLFWKEPEVITNTKMFILAEKLQSGGGGCCRWYRSATGFAAEAESSGDKTGAIRHRAGDSWSRRRPFSHGHTSPGLRAQGS